MRRDDIEKIYKLNQSPITYKLWGVGGGGGRGWVRNGGAARILFVMNSSYEFFFRA